MLFIKWVTNLFKGDDTLKTDLGNKKNECADDPTCADLEASGEEEMMVEYFGYIYSNNKYLINDKPEPDKCAPSIPVNKFTNTGNNCSKLGQVVTFKGLSYICLECADCGGAPAETQIQGLNKYRYQERGSSAPAPNSGDELEERAAGQSRADGQSSGTSGSSSSGGSKTAGPSESSSSGGSKTAGPSESDTGSEAEASATDWFYVPQCNDDDSCGPATCGKWHSINTHRLVRPKATLTIVGRERRNRQASAGNSASDSLEERDGDSRDRGGSRDRDKDPVDPVDPETDTGSGTGTNNGGNINDIGCEPGPIYDASGCKIIGYNPIIMARGKLGFFKSTETYPFTKNCDGDYIYGDKAGKARQLHRMPSRSLEPPFYSKASGVVHSLDPANVEWNNTLVRFIEVEIAGIPIDKIMEETPIPLNMAEPITIMMGERTPENRSIIASGIFINCFKTYVNGEAFAVPKPGVNGFEYFDVDTHYGGKNYHKGGENMDVGAMTFLSPNTMFDRPALYAEQINFDLCLKGKGHVHSHFGEGERPDSAAVARENSKGVVAAMNLAAFDGAQDNRRPAIRCVKAIGYAPHNSVVDKGEKFTYPLLNTYKEGSVYLEMDGAQLPLRDARSRLAPNNGNPAAASLANDGTSDFSAFGQSIFHSFPLHFGSAYYGSLVTYNPNQYGSVVNQTYIDLYPVTMAELESGVVNVKGGDGFIGQMAVKRTSFLSNRIMEEISPLIVGGGITDIPLIGGLLRTIFESVGLEECGTVPENGDTTDPRNGGAGASQDALRISKATPWNGQGAPPPATGKDIFFAGLWKELVWFIVESDVNLGYRQTGSVENGEVFPRKLKGWNLTNTMPQNGDWKKSWMDRMHLLMKENPKWRMILRVVCNLLFTYGVGVYFLICGMQVSVNSGSQMNISWTAFNIGGIIGVILSIVIAALGVAWIIFWANSEEDNRFWDQTLGIDGCWPDIVGPDKAYFETKTGRIRQVEDNYWKYNYDYSKAGNNRITLGLPDPYSTCHCEGEAGYEILYSNKQNPESITDAYRNFNVNDFKELPSHSGKMKKIFKLNSRLFIQTSDSIWYLATDTTERLTTDVVRTLLGSGTFLQVPQEIFGGIKEGRGGTMDPNASEVTPWGYVTIDVESRTIGIFDGNSYRSIGDDGMSKFLDRFMAFDALKDDPKTVRDEKTPIGVGYSIGVDNDRKKLYFTKRDTTAGKDSSWTLTYDPVNQCFICFEYFMPLVYLWDRYNIYSMNKNEMWKHHAQGKFLSCYGKPFDMIFDVVSMARDTYDIFKYESTTVDLEAHVWDGKDFVFTMKEFFTEVGFYNGYQASGLMKLYYGHDVDVTDANKQDDTVINLEYLHRKYRFSDIIDRVREKGSRVFSTFRQGFFTDFTGDIDDQIVDPAIIDNYIVQRFVYSGRTDVKLLLKSVLVDAQDEIR